MRKLQTPAEVDLTGFLRGRTTKNLVAPEVGLEFTYGIISIMSLRKLLKNLTKI
jgi:hypothetical protein